MNRKERRQKEKRDLEIEKKFPEFPEYKLYIKQLLKQVDKEKLKTYSEWLAWRKAGVDLIKVKDE
mgnify:CR=1 FL=1|tara:strand:- start:263 stop:457 length:195 start_codon:yes stop_codon:yes gene_type:complete